MRIPSCSTYNTDALARLGQPHELQSRSERSHETNLELDGVGRVRSHSGRGVKLHSVFLAFSGHARCSLGEPATVLNRRMLIGHRFVPRVCPIGEVWRK